MTIATQQLNQVNGFNLNDIQQLADSVAQDAANGKLKFQIRSAWTGGPRSMTRVESWEMAGQRLSKDFTIAVDEPTELFGNNTAPNPQELLMAAFNSCVIASYVALCSLQGITLETLEVETEGTLDLRGFFGLDAAVKPGYETLRYVLRVKGDAPAEQFAEIHQAMMQISPNFWNMANPIRLQSELCVE